MPDFVDVVVGMLRRADGAVLMASRPSGKPYSGYWEFPGGKVEAGESAEQSLIRELQEELGLQIKKLLPAWQLEHVYPHAHVRLLFYWVTGWKGCLQALESQQLLWVQTQDAWPYPVLPATVPLLEAIRNYKEPSEKEYLVPSISDA
jgi:8-oxo-dGTP diphosphatase